MSLLDFIINPVVLGFIIGAITNGIAIKMLFRPYTKIGFGNFAWQGLIPKRQPELASKIANIITTKLLTQQKITSKFSEANVIDNVRKMVQSLFVNIFDYEFLSLNSYLTPYEKTRLAEALASALERVVSELEDWLKTDDGKSSIKLNIKKLMSYKINKLVRIDKVDVKVWANQTFDYLSNNYNLKSVIKSVLGNILVELANSNKPISEYLSLEVKKVIFDELEKIIPIIHLKIKQAVISPEQIEKIKKVVISSVEKEFDITDITTNNFSNVLEIGARIILKKPVLEKVNTIFENNLPEIEKALDSEQTKEQIRNSIIEILNSFLEQTPAKILEGRDLSQLDFLFENISEVLVEVISSQKSKEIFFEYFSKWLNEICEMSFSQAGLKIISCESPDELEDKLVKIIIDLAENSKISKYVKKQSWWLFDVVLNFPIGRLSRFANLELFNMISEILVIHTTNTIVTKSADIINAIDMEEIIKTEILNYSPHELEKIVLEISKKELKAITYLGGILGALIGLLQYLNLN